MSTDNNKQNYTKHTITLNVKPLTRLVPNAMDKSYTVKDDQSGDWVVITPEKSSPERSRECVDSDDQTPEVSELPASSATKALDFEESGEHIPEEVKPIAEDVSDVVKVEESPPETDEENEKPIPDSTSDIDIIDEDENSSDDELSTASLCSSSVVSQMSNLSFLRDQYLLQNHLLSPEINTEDLSETSSLNFRELNQEVELNPGPRAYVHTPNTGLNGKLNLILVLSVFTVIGLGIGNYIGWSNHWRQNRQLSMGQVNKLKQLQDELVVCMQKQSNKDDSNGQIAGHNGQKPQVCYLDNDYWRQKFETLFSENKGLFDLLEKTQKKYHSSGNLDNVISEKDCDNKTSSDEFHNLKLGLLLNQMEHLKLLKTLEEVQHKGRQSEKRVQDLEVENQELKMKLVEEEADDEVIVQSWGDKVRVLQDENKELHKRLEDDEEEDSLMMKTLNQRIDELLAENNELKSAIAQLEAQVVMVDHKTQTMASAKGNREEQTDDNKPVAIKLDQLKQRINQMVIENDELKSTIARLRWANHKNEVNEEVDKDIKYDPLESEESDEDIDTSEDVIIIKGEDSVADKQMEVQLNLLKEMLSSEQNQSQMWKQMYEQLKQEMLEKVSQAVNDGQHIEEVLEETHGESSEESYEEYTSEEQTHEEPIEDDNNDDQNQKTYDYFDDNMVYDWVLNSTNVLKDALVKGSGILGDKLKTMLDKINENGNFFRGLNVTQKVLFDLHHQLNNKWQELQDLKSVFSNGNQKISNKMAKLLDKTIRKLEEASNRLRTKEEDVNQRVADFSDQIQRLIANLDKKWNNLLNKLSDRYSKQRESSAEDYESSEPTINWFFERAKSRREQQQYSSSFQTDKDGNKPSSFEEVDEPIDDSVADEEENWFLKKARKPKADEESESEFETLEKNDYLSRRQRFKSKRHFAHRFDYNSRYSRHR